MYLVEYPPGAVGSLHVHPQPCVGYVLEGRFESAFGDGPTTVVRAGQGFADITHERHRFRNPDIARVLRFIVAGTFHRDEPLIQDVPGEASFPSAAAEVSSPTDDSDGPTASSAAKPPPEVKRTLLAQKDIPDLPGMESRIYVVEFPPGAASPLHTHPVQGVGYVLEGSFESAFGNDPPTVKRAGESFVDMPGRVHHFRNSDSTRALRFILAGTFHKGDPLMQIVTQE
jgi:quercetin dioxygenase-like cupin family protein